MSRFKTDAEFFFSFSLSVSSSTHKAWLLEEKEIFIRAAWGRLNRNCSQVPNSLFFHPNTYFRGRNEMQTSHPAVDKCMGHVKHFNNTVVVWLYRQIMLELNIMQIYHARFCHTMWFYPIRKLSKVTCPYALFCSLLRNLLFMSYVNFGQLRQIQLCFSGKDTETVLYW